MHVFELLVCHGDRKANAFNLVHNVSEVSRAAGNHGAEET